MQRAVSEMHEEGLLIDKVAIIAGDASVCLVIGVRIIIGFIGRVILMNGCVIKVLRGKIRLGP